MRMWGAALTTVHSSDADTQRRGRVLIIVAIGMAVLALAFVPVILSTTGGTVELAIIAIATVVFIVAALLGRAGRVTLGAYLVIGVSLLGVTGGMLGGTSTANTPFYMILIVMLAGALLPPMQIWGMLVASILGIALGFTLLPAELRTGLAWRQASVGAPLLLIVVALLAFLSSQGASKALAAARQARDEAEQANAALAASNASLEARVEERTAALRLIADEQRAATAQLQASITAQQDLNQVIAELSMPIIPISSTTLVVPLIGNIDSARANQLLDTVLERVESSGARTVVLDVTGVAIVDTQVAAAMLRVAAAARLMGAETMLVGIRPEVAQTLVQLGVDLATLRTASTLQAGLTNLEASSKP